MDKSLLYLNGKCRLCGEGSGHKIDCPGHVIENLVCEVVYSWEGCSRGCCGRDKGSFTADSTESAIDRILDNDKSVETAAYLDASARLVFELPVDAAGILRAKINSIHNRGNVPTPEREVASIGVDSRAFFTVDTGRSREILVIHPARQIPYSILLSELRERVAQKLVTESRDGPLALFSYTKGCQYEKRWDDYTSIARGLILDLESESVTATPFPKFFNFGERTALIPDEPFDVYEKLDGSLGIVFFYDGQWRCASKGSFTSPQARWGENWISARVSRETLIPGNTYLFEIVYPENRIVVRYPFSEMVLLSIYRSDGIELSASDLSAAASAIGVRMANRYHFSSMSELVGAVSEFSSDREGVVVRFQSGLRLKVKGREYCRLHRTVSSVTPLALHGLMASMVDLEVHRQAIPEEFIAEFDAIVSCLSGQREAIIAGVEKAHQQTAHLSDREVATANVMMESAHRPFLFQRRKSGPEWWKLPKSHDAIYRQIRPTGNRLVGYDPSMNLLRRGDE